MSHNVSQPPPPPPRPKEFVSFTPDRSLRVPHGHVVRTQWVSVWDCRMACRERMAVGDVKGAYERLLQQSGHAVWPLPNGHWEDAPIHGREFVIEDGRHEYVAALMLGHTHILVAWVE